MAKKNTLSEIRIEPIQKGGYIVHHSTMGSGPYKAPTKYAFGNHKDMLAHVKTVTAVKRPANFREALNSLKTPR